MLAITKVLISKNRVLKRHTACFGRGLLLHTSAITQIQYDNLDETSGKIG